MTIYELERRIENVRSRLAHLRDCANEDMFNAEERSSYNGEDAEYWQNSGSAVAYELALSIITEELNDL